MTKFKTIAFATLSCVALAACGGAGGGASGSRDSIRAVGSSTVYPFAKKVAEEFVAANPGMKSPLIESTGTGGGIKLFCAGVGAQHPDMVNASRRLKASELEDCKKNGVTEIVEIEVGKDGIAIAESKKGPEFGLTVQQVYEAVAKNPYGKPNTAKTWHDVNPALPAQKIRVMGPPPTSGTRDSLGSSDCSPWSVVPWASVRSFCSG